MTPLHWLGGNEFELGQDPGFRLNMVDYFKSLFFSWNTQGFGVDLTLFKGFLVAQLPETIFTVVTGSLHWGPVLAFIFWFFAMATSMYILINSLFPEKKHWIFRVFSSVFYACNFYILQAWFIAERGKFSLYVALPLGFLVIYKLFKRKLSFLKAAVLFSLIFFVFNGGGSPALYGGVLLTYGLTFLYLGAIDVIKNGLKGLIFSLKSIFVLAAATVLLNMHWILPQLNLYVRSFEQTLGASGGVAGVLDWEKTVNAHASFINLFRLQGIPDWFGGDHPYSRLFLESPSLIFLSLIPFLVILFGLLFKKSTIQGKGRKEIIYLLFAIFLWGAIFTAGSRPPFGALYTFLTEKLPGFVIFRSSFYKFAPAFWFSFTFLAGYFASELLQKFFKRTLQKSLGIFAISLVLIYHFPYFSGNFFAWNPPFTTKVSAPGHVRNTANYIDNNLPAESRTLLLPKLDDQFRADSYEWGYFSLDLLPRMATNKSIVANDNSSPPVVENLYEYLEVGDLDSFISLSRLLGINTFLWRDDVLYSDKETTSEDFRFLEQKLIGSNQFKKVFEDGEWRLYALESSAPALFSGFSKGISANVGAGDVLKVNEVSGQEDLPVFYDNSKGVFTEGSNTIAADVVVASCSVCGPAEFDDLVSTVKFGTGILPDSYFYPLLLYKEGRLIETFSDIPTQRVDVDLSIANKRVSELPALLGKERSYKEDYSDLIKTSIGRYKERMTDAVSQLTLMSDIDKNYYTIKVLAYLEAQARFLDVLDNTEDIFGDPMYDELATFIRENEHKLSGTTWQAEFPSTQRYFVTVNREGEYGLVFSPQKPPLEGVQINGESVQNETFLERGTHRLEVVYPEAHNLLSVADEEGTMSLDLVSGQPEVLSADLEVSHTYLLKFKYRTVSGGAPEFLLTESDTSSRRKLNTDGRWHDFGIIFSPEDDEHVQFSFMVPGVDKRSTLEIRNLGVFEYYTPTVLLVRSEDFSQDSISEVQYEKIGPTKYSLKVNGGSSPQFLVFKQNYNDGWRLNLKGDGTVVAHTTADGYANAWVVDTDTYEATLVYWPQKIFYFGLTITGLALLTSFVLWRKQP